ncbi:hypothetical protein OC861_004117 [Tilletia horrida]|nr:hypothetical protein OC861_004117 [Tilletia horrida]
MALDWAPESASASRRPLAELPLEPFVRAAQQQQELLLGENHADSASATSSCASSPRKRSTANGINSLPHSPVKPSPLSPHAYRSPGSTRILPQLLTPGGLRPSNSDAAIGASGKGGKLFEKELIANNNIPMDGSDDIEQSPAIMPPPKTSPSKQGGKSRSRPGPIALPRRQRDVSPSPSPSPGISTSLLSTFRTQAREARQATPLEQVGTEPRNKRPHKDKEAIHQYSGPIPPADENDDSVGSGASPSARLEKSNSPSKISPGEQVLPVSSPCDLKPTSAVQGISQESAPTTPLLGSVSGPDGELTAFEDGPASLARKKDRIRLADVVHSVRSPSPHKNMGKGKGRPVEVIATNATGTSAKLEPWDGTGVWEDEEAELEMALSGVYASAAFEARAHSRSRSHSQNQKGREDGIITALSSTVSPMPKLSAKRMAPRSTPVPDSPGSPSMGAKAKDRKASLTRKRQDRGRERSGSGSVPTIPEGSSTDGIIMTTKATRPTTGPELRTIEVNQDVAPIGGSIAEAIAVTKGQTEEEGADEAERPSKIRRSK